MFGYNFTVGKQQRNGKKQPGDDLELAKQLIEAGSDSVGAATGAAIGLIGGPIGVVGGAALGAVFGKVLVKVGSDLKRRFLGPREEMRIGGVMIAAGARIQEKLDRGETPRTDGFFDTPEDSSRPPAEELLEGVLLKARDSFDEKRLDLLGRLYASIAFSDIAPVHASHLIHLAGDLTYRQLVALGIAGAQTLTKQPLLREGDFRSDEVAKNRLGTGGVGLVTELYELYQKGLIHDANGSAWISVGDVNPGGMRVQGSGSVLFNMMELGSLVVAELPSFQEFFPLKTGTGG